MFYTLLYSWEMAVKGYTLHDFHMPFTVCYMVGFPVVKSIENETETIIKTIIATVH